MADAALEWPLPAHTPHPGYAGGHPPKRPPWSADLDAVRADLMAVLEHRGRNYLVHRDEITARLDALDKRVGDLAHLLERVELNAATEYAEARTTASVANRLTDRLNHLSALVAEQQRGIERVELNARAMLPRVAALEARWREVDEVGLPDPCQDGLSGQNRDTSPRSIATVTGSDDPPTSVARAALERADSSVDPAPTFPTLWGYAFHRVGGDVAFCYQCLTIDDPVTGSVSRDWLRRVLASEADRNAEDWVGRLYRGDGDVRCVFCGRTAAT